jgi:hypothetical protein
MVTSDHTESAPEKLTQSTNLNIHHSELLKALESQTSSNPSISMMAYHNLYLSSCYQNSFLQHSNHFGHLLAHNGKILSFEMF